MARTSESASLPAIFQWTLSGRLLVFFLSATSIWCLLAEFYQICSMRTFTFFVLVPAGGVLAAMAVVNHLRGDGRLARACWVGAIGGLLAAVTYDLFRLPFVVAAADHTGPMWLRLPLFRVFPRFGALILGQPFSAATSDSQFPLLTHVVGWTYHLSNGMTFGIMYLAIIGDAGRRSWVHGVTLAAGLEAALLVTPYTSFFGIPPTARFVIVTLTAHVLFGVTLGLYARHKSTNPPLDATRVSMT